MECRTQRIARRYKKAFLNKQCKKQREGEEWEIRVLCKKIKDIKGIFHTKDEHDKG